MLPHLLRVVLLHLHVSPSARLLYDEIVQFSRHEMRALVSSGILVEQSLTEFVICEECERRCSREVEYTKQPGGSLSAFIRCHRHKGRMPIAPERTKFWKTSRTSLVAILREFLGIVHPLHEVVQGRVWRLGSLGTDSGRADVFFAAGVKAKDFKSVWRDAIPAMEECSKPVLITPSEFAPPKKKRPSNLQTVSLMRLMSIEDNVGLFLDVDEIRRVAGTRRSVADADTSDFRFSEGFTSVCAHGREYKLTPFQAMAVKALYEAHQNGTPWLHKDHLLIGVLESSQMRLRDIFKRNKDAWTNLIVSDGRGNHRLNID